MKPAILHAEAQAEVDDAMVYYELQRRGLGLELQDEVVQALHRVRMNPELGEPYKKTEFSTTRRSSIPV